MVVDALMDEDLLWMSTSNKTYFKSFKANLNRCRGDTDHIERSVHLKEAVSDENFTRREIKSVDKEFLNQMGMWFVR